MKCTGDFLPKAIRAFWIFVASIFNYFGKIKGSLLIKFLTKVIKKSFLTIAAFITVIVLMKMEVKTSGSEGILTAIGACQ